MRSILDQKLMMYTATTATLATAGLSQAAIVYTPSTASRNTQGDLNVDLDNDGVNDIDIHLNSANKNSDKYYLISPGTTGGSWASTSANDGDAGRAPLAVAAGQVIDASLSYDKTNGPNADDTLSPAPGAFVTDNTTVNYIGVQFTHAGATDYGWVGVKLGPVSATATTEVVTLAGYAYEDTGAGIAAGATGATPEPAALATLALGAGALLRRKR